MQVSWDATDPKTAEREQRAFDQAQKELRISGRLITCNDCLRSIDRYGD